MYAPLPVQIPNRNLDKFGITKFWIPIGTTSRYPPVQIVWPVAGDDQDGDAGHRAVADGRGVILQRRRVPAGAHAAVPLCGVTELAPPHRFLRVGPRTLGVLGRAGEGRGQTSVRGVTELTQSLESRNKQLPVKQESQHHHKRKRQRRPR